MIEATTADNVTVQLRRGRHSRSNFASSEAGWLLVGICRGWGPDFG